MTPRANWVIEEPEEFEEFVMGEEVPTDRFAECRIIVDADAEAVLRHSGGKEAALALAQRIVEQGPDGVRGVFSKPRNLLHQCLRSKVPPVHFAECKIVVDADTEITVRHNQGEAAVMALAERIAAARTNTLPEETADPATQ